MLTSQPGEVESLKRTHRGRSNYALVVSQATYSPNTVAYGQASAHVPHFHTKGGMRAMITYVILVLKVLIVALEIIKTFWC